MPFLFNQQTYSCIFISNSILIYAFSVQSANLFMHFQFKQHSYLCLFCSISKLIHAFSVQTAFLFMPFLFNQHSYQFFTVFEQAHEILVIFAFSSNEGSDKPAQICRLSSAFTMCRSKGGGETGGNTGEAQTRCPSVSSQAIYH